MFSSRHVKGTIRLIQPIDLTLICGNCFLRKLWDHTYYQAHPNGKCTLWLEVVVEKGLGVSCMWTCMFNSVCSKYLNRILQTSMFLISSSLTWHSFVASVVWWSSETTMTTTAVDSWCECPKLILVASGSAERFEGSMLFFICNSICSKHLDRTLQSSMFLMSSSRHVKGGYDW